MVFCKGVGGDAVRSVATRRRRPGREFIKERVAMALLTFLIHVSSARAAFPPVRRLLGNLAGKLTPQFLYLFSRLRGASILFISRFDRAAAFS